MIRLLTSYKGKYAAKLNAAAQAASKVLGQTGELSVSLEFVSGERMRRLNLEFRGADKPTDVLSFPNLELKKPASTRLPDVKAKDWPLEAEDGAVFLGDIVICGAVARKQSAEYGHTEERETVYLFTHGLLHLFGFDHAEEGDKRLMREAEERIMDEAGNNDKHQDLSFIKDN